MILSIANCLKSWFELTRNDFVPINQNQLQNANSINTAGTVAVLDVATKTELKLISTLKQYFPLAVNLFDDMKSVIALNFLSRWPTLDELRRVKAQTVRSFF